MAAKYDNSTGTNLYWDQMSVSGQSWWTKQDFGPFTPVHYSKSIVFHVKKVQYHPTIKWFVDSQISILDPGLAQSWKKQIHFLA